MEATHSVHAEINGSVGFDALWLFAVSDLSVCVTGVTTDFVGERHFWKSKEYGEVDVFGTSNRDGCMVEFRSESVEERGRGENGAGEDLFLSTCSSRLFTCLLRGDSGAVRM